MFLNGVTDTKGECRCEGRRRPEICRYKNQRDWRVVFALSHPRPDLELTQISVNNLDADKHLKCKLVKGEPELHSYDWNQHVPHVQVEAQMRRQPLQASDAGGGA